MEVWHPWPAMPPLHRLIHGAGSEALRLTRRTPSADSPGNMPGDLSVQGFLVSFFSRDAAVAKDFKVYYKKVEGKTPTSYTMDHSAGSYLYDPQGRLRVYHRYARGAPALAEDVKTLLQSR